MSTTRTISLPPSPGCLASAIKTLHSITESSSVSIVASDKKECSGVMTTVHTPSNSITGRPSHAVSTEGVSGAVRALDSAEPSACLLGATAEERGKVESWIENVESNLLTMLGAEVKVTLAKSVAEEYVGIVSKHLSVEKGAYLVGDYLTAADVITACVLAELMGKVGGMKCADGLRKWMETVAVGACGMKLELGEEKSAAASKEEKPAAATSSDGSISILTDSASVPILATLGSISHTTYTHSSAKTVEELLVACPLPPLPGAPDGTHTKNLFLKDKKHGSFLVTAHPESDTNTKGLAKHLKLTGKVNLRFADVAHLDKCLGCEPGHVGPMCISNDKEKIVTVVLDSKIAKAEAVYSHPGRNDMSTVMAGEELVK
uniref:YbaK/aminoacyl-tRNA synthetase-associated domain-containing protein n=1 Tax=Corethron hystrix TaxID=216773 RepID=A0A7S1BFB7_9STRA